MKKWKINLLMLVFIMGAIGVLELNTQLKYNLNLVDYYKYNRGYNKSLENIDDERALTIGVYDEAPIAYLNQFNNYNTGLVVDYISQISIEIRSDIHLKVLQKGELFDALEQGTVDGVVAERTEDRADIFEFTQMLCVVRGRVAVPVKTGVGSIEELRGKTLVTLVSDNKGNRITSFFERYDDIEVIEVENMYQCFALINNDIAVGFVGDDMEVARYLNVTSRDTSYVFLKPILYEEEICLALLKGNEELRKLHNL